MAMQGQPPCHSHAHSNSILKTKVNFVHLPFQGGFSLLGSPWLDEFKAVLSLGQNL